MPRNPLRSAGILAAAGAAVLALGALIPGTSGAFTAVVTNTVDTAASKAVFTCADSFAAPARRANAFFEFALDEDAGATTAADSSTAGNPGAYGGSNAKDSTDPLACPNDAGGVYALDGSTSRVTTSVGFAPITGSFSEELWFRTSASGKLLGFESTVADLSDHYDKHLYVGTSGHLVFGVYSGGTHTLSSPDIVNDGRWHQAAATTSGSGSVLYLDGQRVASDGGMTTAENFGGYWRLGSGRLDGWPDQPSTNWFTGSLRYAAAYSFVLTPQQVAADAAFGAPAPSVTASTAPTATPTPTPTPSTEPTPADTPVTVRTARPMPTAGPIRGDPVQSTGTDGTAAPVTAAPDDASTSTSGATADPANR